MPVDRLPAHPDELDARWLTAALSARHPGVSVAAVEVLRVDEVTNTHVALRLQYEEAAGAPERLFAKLPPLDPARRPAIVATGMGVREARFYDLLAPLVDLRVPAGHAALHDGDGNFMLLLEDLDTTGCTVSDGPTGVAPDAAARALEDLAGLHARFADPVRRRAEAGWVPPPGEGSDYAVGRLRHAVDHHPDRLGEAFVAVAERYVADRHSLQRLWHRGPVSVVHGDPHVGNVFDDHGRTGFLDWGMVMVTTPLRDVAYFLTMALSIEDRRAHDAELLRHYLDVSRALGGHDLGWDEAWLDYRLQAAYTVPASCQVAAPDPTAGERRRIFADAFLARARAAVEDLDPLDAVRAAGG